MKQKNSKAQASQDLFALEICTNKSYIEIGGNHPRRINNTYVLDVDYNWKGFSVELIKKWAPAWNKSSRNNNCYFADAITFDYAAALKDLGMDKKVGYLSCDIEPPANTFAALQQVIGQGIKFECITFEHDLYNFPNTTFDKQATDFLSKHGYKVAVNNVFCNEPNMLYETWYVSEDCNYDIIDFANWKIKLDI